LLSIGTSSLRISRSLFIKKVSLNVIKYRSKKYFHFISFSLLSLIMGCFGGDRGDLHYSDSDIIRVPSSIGEGLYQTKCSSCHGPIESSSKIGRSFNQIKTAIDAGTILEMSTQTLRALTDVEIQYIADSLNRTIPQGDSLGLKYAQVLGGRTFLASKFTEIFAGTDGNTAINNIINTFKNNPGYLGGKCPHLELCSGTRGDSQQPDADARVHPLSSVTRRGFVTQTCQEILSIDTAVNNTLAKAGLTSNSAANTTNIDALFSTMNPSVVYDSAGSTGLINLHNEARTTQKLSNFRAWRMVIYAICVSPNFEAI
jgi:hypothetical protein